MTSAARPVARLTSPGEIAAVVPALCGFVPRESLVVISLRGPRRRLGLTMRFDLDHVLDDVSAAAAEVAGRLELDGADRAVVVVLTEAPGALVRLEVVDALHVACEDAGLQVDEALLVRGGRWWSYVCADPRCCPPEGTPLERAPSAALQLVEAEQVLQGRAVLDSREELAASVAPPVLLAEAAADQHAAAALHDWAERTRRLGVDAVRACSLSLAGRLLDASQVGTPVSAVDAAQLAVAVQDVVVRDEIATWCLTRHDALLAVLLQTARQVVPPEDAQVLALLAWVAYAHGDGGLANVALERCLRSDPTCSLARLLGQALDAQVPPDEVRALLRATSAELAQRRDR